MRDNNINATKGLAIIGVALHHIGNRRLEAQPLEWVAMLQTIFCWCVFAFFATSGWLHALKEEKEKQPFASFAILRVRRLLVPFVLLILFYAAVWQVVQSHQSVELRGVISSTYSGKVLDSLWPVGKGIVAEQLYFLPMLFAICIVAHLALRVGGMIGITSLAGLAYLAGLWFFPHSSNTGFTLGVLIWGIFLYSGGFLLYAHRKHFAFWKVLACLILLGLLVTGISILGKFVALLLLAFSRSLRLAAIPLLVMLGDASGTIYIYHTPFILQPLMIIACKMHGPYAQFLAALIAMAAAIGICTFAFFQLRRTALKRILL